MASAIDFLPTISSCQAVSQMNLATARWRPHAGYHCSDRTIQFSMKCIPELSEVAASTKHPCFVSNLPQIRNPHQPILAGECQRLVYALRLGHAEDSMFSSIVNLYIFAVFDCQSPSVGEDCILKVIF